MSPQSEDERARAPLAGDRERRQNQRHAGKAIVEIIRESDSRRINFPVNLVDISVSGIGLEAIEPFVSGDHLKIRLRNDIRRILKEVRGVVKWVQPTESGTCRIGIELMSRLTTLDMQLLKQVGAAESAGKIWV